MKTILRIILLFCLSSCYYQNLSGQILNIEKERLDSINPEKPYSITFESKLGAFNRSATENERAEFINFSNKLNAVVAPKRKHAYVAMGQFHFTENNGQTILNNAYLHLRSTFNYRKKWSPELYAQIQDDQFRGLRNRKLLGGAMRWQPIDSKKVRFVLAAGPMFESEDWINVETGESRQLELWKLNSYMLFRWDVSKSFNLNTVFYYQVGYDQGARIDRQRVSNNTNLNFEISNFLSFTITYQMAYENEPIFPITKFIYSIENGITLRF